MRAQLLVLAKEPVPGRVKTRLCPPATAEQAARVAAAALADTLDTVAAAAADRRVLVLSGQPVPHPGGIAVVRQRGEGLAERLANAYADTARPGTASLLVGMDTPQLTGAALTTALARLRDTDAVLGPATDGGWWALGLRDPVHGAALRGVPMSRPDTGERTLAALRERGLRVAVLAELRDVDTATDAQLVAAAMADRTGSRFVTAVRDVFGSAVAV